MAPTRRPRADPENVFSGLSSPIAKTICASAKMTTQTWIKQLTPQNVEALYRAMQEKKVMAWGWVC